MSIYDYLIYFWQKNEYDQCSLSEIALYFCLLHESNRQHWASPFKASTQMLMARLGTSKPNMTARVSLPYTHSSSVRKRMTGNHKS